MQWAQRQRGRDCFVEPSAISLFPVTHDAIAPWFLCPPVPQTDAWPRVCWDDASRDVKKNFLTTSLCGAHKSALTAGPTPCCSKEPLSMLICALSSRPVSPAGPAPGLHSLTH